MFVVTLLSAFAFLVASIVFVAGHFARSRRERSTRLDSRRRNDELCRKAEWLQSEAARLGARCAERDLENAELRRALEKLDAGRSRLESETAELRAEAKTADTVIRNLSDEHRLRQQAEDRRAEIQTLLERTSQELCETRGLLGAERAERVQSDQARASLCETLRQLKVDRDRWESSLLAAENKAQRIPVLEKELAAATRELGYAAEKRARSAEALERATGDAQERAADVERLQTEIASLRRTQRTEHDELSELKVRLAETSSRCRSEQAKTLAADALYQDAMLRWTTAEAELRELRLRAQRAEATVTELQRGQQASDAEEKLLLQQMEAQAAIAQADLREARMKLSATESKLATLEQLRDENLALREVGRDAEETAQMFAATQAELRELRAKLQTLTPKLQELDRVADENRSLRAQVAELETNRAAADELERMTVEHKRLRLESELMTRRLQELEDERMELFELRARVDELSSVADEVSDLRRHEAELEAQLFSTIRHSQTIPGVEGGGLHTLSEVDESPDAEGVLSGLVGPGRARSAALADRLGLLVAGAGERQLEEGLAAFAGLASEMAERARTLLPIGPMVKVSLCATNDVRVSCRFFLASGIEYALATIATGNIDSGGDERAASALAGVLSPEHALLPESAAS